jgi:hypothetical protein
MSRFSLPALACACALTLGVTPGRADELKASPEKTDQVAVILATLETEVQLKEGINVNDIPLFELLQELSKKHNVTFIIMEEYFKPVGRPTVREDRPQLATTQVRGLHLHQFLRVVLDGMGATYLVRNNSIEIVPVQYAAKVTKSTLIPAAAEGARPRLGEVLVSAVVKEKPLSEAIAKIAETYDLTVAVSPQAGEARKEPVSARLLNAPADKALELLALQADLRVVRRGAAFLVTSKEHAGEIFDEEQNKERQKIELKRLREEKPVSPRP